MCLKGVILRIGEAEIPACPLALNLLSYRNTASLGGKLKLNCVLICIIVHINEAQVYEYSYFCFVV